jgi:hypothetical protein
MLRNALLLAALTFSRKMRALHGASKPIPTWYRITFDEFEVRIAN